MSLAVVIPLAIISAIARSLPLETKLGAANLVSKGHMTSLNHLSSGSELPIPLSKDIAK